MKKFIMRHVIEPIRLVRSYFSTGHEDIASANLSMMSTVSLFGFFITALLIFAAEMIIPGWLPTPAHMMLVVFFALFTGITYLMRKRDSHTYRFSQFVLSAYLAFVMSFFLYIELGAYEKASVTIPACAMVGLPVLFVLAPWQALLLLGGTTGTIVVMLRANAFTQSNVEGQLFYCLFAFVFGLAAYWVAISLRAGDNAARAELVRYSAIDQLTGTMNKGTAERNSTLYLADKGAEDCTMLVLDIDNFKGVNDNNGHLTGDKVLTIVGRELKATFRESDIVGRIGGDEFMALIKNLSKTRMVEAKLDSFTRKVKQAAATECGLDITCSIGGITVSGEDIPYDELFTYADNMLYRAKRSGKNSYMLMPLKAYREMNLQRKRMLIVDDEDVNIQLLDRIFNEEYKIETAHDGEEALALLAQNKMRFSVILLDLIMPKLDGRGVLKALRADPAMRNVPVVIVSSDEKSELQMLELGVADMITRPFDSRIVHQRVTNAVKHWHPAVK